MLWLESEDYKYRTVLSENSYFRVFYLMIRLEESLKMIAVLETYISKAIWGHPYI